MTLRSVLRTATTVVLAVLVVALVAGAVMGQPVLLGYVTTDSMEPTLEPGDGFVAIPDAVAGDPEPGDVVVFEAEELHGGGLTTHRVVDETQEGYVTKGDANPFTDQDSDEPPVTDDRIVAHALQIGDSVVVLPGVGTAVGSAQSTVASAQRGVGNALGVGPLVSPGSVGALFVVAGVLLFLISFVGGSGRRRERSRSRDRETEFDARLVVLALLALVVVPATLAMVAPSGTTAVTIDGGDAAEAGLESGEPVEHEVTAHNDGVVAMLVVLDAPAEDATLSDRALVVPAGATVETTLSAPVPPDETRAVTMTEHRYFLLLPESVLVGLHGVSPVLAWGTLVGLLGMGVAGLAVGLLGFGRRRVRDTSRDLPVGERVRRLFR